MLIKPRLLFFIVYLICHYQAIATDYYVHPKLGNDINNGLTKAFPLKTLSAISKINLHPGDRVFLASGESYNTGISLINQHGTRNNPIVITTINWEAPGAIIPATIDFKGAPQGILIQDCNFIDVSNIKLTGNGYDKNSEASSMRCGVLVTSEKAKLMEGITVKDLTITDVFYENPGFVRGKEEVKTANGTQKYGWGIRVITDNKTNLIKDVAIKNCQITGVSHTGIKLTGHSKNIIDVKITDNRLERTGGPGIQMSGVENVYVANNYVSHSGSNDDTRKWGRGSGLWTWGASHVLIEKNKFLFANGPGDSAGAHIDYNCDNIVLQYNISAHNAGGFCEILGNNYNCAYRYNISINDGHRVKGVDGAFQEGKILWLSGYQGQKPRKGPVNSYFYNNTIYSNKSIVAKIAIDNTSSGILIANNIFYLEGKSISVLGDQYKPDTKNGDRVKNVFFKNNLFIKKNSWPKDTGINDIAPIVGNPGFKNKGGMEAEDYTPKHVKLIKHKGIDINLLPNDTIGLMQSLKMEKDFLGNAINGKPSLGAIEP